MKESDFTHIMGRRLAPKLQLPTRRKKSDPAYPPNRVRGVDSNDALALRLPCGCNAEKSIVAIFEPTSINQKDRLRSGNCSIAADKILSGGRHAQRSLTVWTAGPCASFALPNAGRDEILFQ